MTLPASRRRIRGVALISVLLVAAILAAIVHRVTAQHSLNLAHSQNSVGYDQALAYALGGEALARQMLYEDFRDDLKEDTGKVIDSLDEPWAQAVPPLDMDGVGYIEIQAKDLNSCFNLNAISDLGADPEGSAGRGPDQTEGGGTGDETGTEGAEDADNGAGDPELMDADKQLKQRKQQLDRFINLLRNLRLEEPEMLADALWDWMDEDQEVSTERFPAVGAEDRDYLGMDPAYRTADRSLTHISELRLLRGMTPQDFEQLAPHICVLPTSELKINVNTAKGQALAALAQGVNEFQVLELMDWMETERPFKEVDKFLSMEENPNHLQAKFQPVKGFLAIASEYFEVQVRVQVGHSIAVLTSVLHRNPTNGSIKLISRDMGRDFLSQFAAQEEAAQEEEG